MTADRSPRARSSTSRRRPSRRSPRPAEASSTSVSTGDVAPAPSGDAPRALGVTAIRDLARRHGIRPARSLGQHFLIDPNLAWAISTDAGVSRGEHVIEVGAGLGSLTVALAATGADVLAVEFDRALLPALEEVVGGAANVHVRHADAMKIDWTKELTGPAKWVLCANLPYNVATPLVLEVLHGVPAVRRLVVMVQREVGERLVAKVGDAGYGAASVRIAFRATAELIRKVPPNVFWPRPSVESVVVRLDRRATPAAEVDERDFRRVVDAGFAERRKTMRNALRRLGLSPGDAERMLAACEIPADARAEELDLAAFARLAKAVAA